jgi:hypothetical protein
MSEATFEKPDTASPLVVEPTLIEVEMQLGVLMPFGSRRHPRR